MKDDEDFNEYKWLDDMSEDDKRSLGTQLAWLFALIWIATVGGLMLVWWWF